VTSSTREERPANILIVDDDPDLRELLAHALRGVEPGRIEEAGSASEARALITRRAFDVVITDLSMPDEGGLSLMQWSHEHCPGPSWIVLTGYGTFDTAVKALQLGAFDFLTKPIQPIEPLCHSVRNAIAHQRLVAERDRLNAELGESNEALRLHVGQLVEAYGLVREQTEILRADLRRAGIIQQALLPDAAPAMQNFHVDSLYRPSQHVGGDLYDVLRIDDRHVVLLIADAAGHGLAAAMLAVLFRSRLPIVDPETNAPRDPAVVLSDVNQTLSAAFPAPGLFLTAAYCLLDTKQGVATIASAGHPPLLWLRAGGAVERIFHTGPALGLTAKADYTQRRLDLEPGEGLLFYSDGLYDSFDGEPESPSDAIAGALDAAQSGLGAIEPLLARFRERRDDADPPRDDVTILLLTAAPGPSVLDNEPPPTLPMPAQRSELAETATLVGCESGRTTFSIQGRGEWSRSAAFHSECAAELKAGRDVMLDLTLCHLLDSTYLGTIHLLCELADDAGVEFRLQGVTPAVEALFEELGMQNVIEHIVPRMLPLPTQMVPVGSSAPDPSARALLLLRAHEGLATLSDHNRQEFDPLVTQLRQELAALSR
jgi:sigma-B regulation protein RsbU (phosphoserine phosphatase)